MKITKYTKEGIFLESYNTIVEASKNTNVRAENISRVITGKRKEAGGFQWKRTNSFENITAIEETQRGDAILQIDIESKQILNIFPNAVTAATFLGLKETSSIAACASHQILPSGFSRETAHGYIWEWKDKIVPPRILKNTIDKTEEEIILYRRWTGIKARCYNKNDTTYYLYGAVGTTMCKEWLENFNSFKDWALENGFKKKLEIDKDILCEKLGVYPKIYSPETCKWVTKKENMAQQERENTSKVVYQYNLQGELLNSYKSIAIASIKTNVNNRAIARVAKLERGTAGGYLWRFTKEEDIKQNRKITKSINQIDINTKQIIATYSHIDDAVLNVNGAKSTIYSACLGHKKSAYGYIWQYA